MKLHRTLLSTLVLASPAVPVMAVEEPRYEVEQRDGAFELRRYAPHLIAETRVDAAFDDAGDQAFRRLFGFISGDNRGERKIAMTAPVIQQEASGSKFPMTAPVRQEADLTSGFLIAFVVPAEFTRGTVPEPTDPLVKIREVPEQRMAVVRYSGRWTEANYSKHEIALNEWLIKRGLRKIGPAVYARYNAPFVPWPMRRNEVMVQVTAQR